MSAMVAMINLLSPNILILDYPAVEEKDLHGHMETSGLLLTQIGLVMADKSLAQEVGARSFSSQFSSDEEDPGDYLKVRGEGQYKKDG